MAKIVSISAPLWRGYSPDRTYDKIGWTFVAGMDNETVRLLSLHFEKETRRFTVRDATHMVACGDLKLGHAVLMIPRSPVTKRTTMLMACRKALPPEEIAFATAEAIRIAA